MHVEISLPAGIVELELKEFLCDVGKRHCSLDFHRRRTYQTFNVSNVLKSTRYLNDNTGAMVFVTASETAVHELLR